MKSSTVRIALLLLSFFFFGCEKEKTEDFSNLFKNTVWTGELKYTARPIRDPFSIAFDAGGTLTWYQYDGQYQGNYVVDVEKKEVTIYFGQGNSFTAVINDNKQFGNIRYNNAIGWSILSGELNNSVDQPLDNTTWEGEIIMGGGGSPAPFSLLFKPGSLVAVGGSGTNFSYVRKSGTIRFEWANAAFFATISGNRMSGRYLSGNVIYYSWVITKK